MGATARLPTEPVTLQFTTLPSATNPSPFLLLRTKEYEKISKLLWSTSMLHQSSWRIFFPFYCLFEVKPPYDPVCPSIGRLVVWYVGLTVIMSKKGVKFHFHASTVAHVILILHYFSKAWSLGSPVNCQNGDKRTPLHLSVINGNMETVRALLKVGASPNAQVNLFTQT